MLYEKRVILIIIVAVCAMLAVAASRRREGFYVFMDRVAAPKKESAPTAAAAATEGVQLVIARYNEDLEFLQYQPFSDYKNVIIYNKGPTLPKWYPSYAKIVSLPNVGKCDHTYLYHIIDNYDNLAKITVFLPASCTMNAIKTNKTYRVLQYVEKTQNSAFIGQPVNDVGQDLYDFRIDWYVTANKENRQLNNGSAVKPCAIAPFGKWFYSNFGNTKTTLVDYTSIFAVAQDHILQHPKEYYENLIKYVDDDISPECGHFMERAWVTVFSPLPAECLYSNPM